MSTLSTVLLLALALSTSTVSGQKFKDGRSLNLAYAYSSDFHVSFALTAFTTIVFALTVFGVSLGMWFMDPGRDSIIYRMTSQRMKKDQ